MYKADFTLLALALPYPEHLGAAYRAHPLGCWLFILHDNTSGIFDFPLGAAFHTIGLHLHLQFFILNDSLFERDCQYPCEKILSGTLNIF